MSPAFDARSFSAFARNSAAAIFRRRIERCDAGIDAISLVVGDPNINPR
jgi:hypothetical protein